MPNVHEEFKFPGLSRESNNSLVHEQADPFTRRKAILVRAAFELPFAIPLPYQGCIAETGDHFTFIRTV
jgi:hypothetical protein